MGKSRSATLIVAYLLSSSQHYTPISALMHLRLARPMAEPNPGFMDQLHLYHRMHCPWEIDSQPLYQRWCYKRERERSRKAEQAPGSEFIVFEDDMRKAVDPKREEEEEEEEKEGIDDGQPSGKIRDGNEKSAAAEGTESSDKNIPYEDDEGDQAKTEEYRCRRCRTALGNSSYSVPHTPRQTAKAPQ
ncbi:MAG: hypothetical protein Q9211_006637, partial [Gyalolechia sp. 1 TL-2023]